MRGKHQALFFLSVVVRITPADAGKTEKPCRHFECAWDHPRGCGENRNSQGYTRSGRGSPPRMRGKPHSPYISPPRVRITPADAGKTGISFGIRAGGRDHPRGCGENVHSFRNRCTEVGSPPHIPFILYRGRNRTADAFKTPAKALLMSLVQDHPRGCGENPQ